MKCYLRVELYIALYGGAFIEPLTSSRSRSRSRTPSESSVGPSSVKRNRRTKKEENEITAAGKIMSAYECDQVTWVWYLRALEDDSIRRGFWIRADTEKKSYLDAVLVSSKGLCGKYSIYWAYIFSWYEPLCFSSCSQWWRVNIIWNTAWRTPPSDPREENGGWCLLLPLPLPAAASSGWSLCCEIVAMFFTSFGVFRHVLLNCYVFGR